MVLGVRDVEQALVDAAAVRSGQLRRRRRAAVAAASGPSVTGHRANSPCGRVDPAHAVIFRIDDIDRAVRSDMDPLRAAEGGGARQAAVAAVAFGSGAGDRLDDAGLRVHLADAVALALADIDAACAVDVDGARAVDGGRGRRTAVPREGPPAGAGEGIDQARRQVDLANAIVGDVGDIEGAVPVEGESVGLAELRPVGGSTVAAKARRAGAGQRGDNAGARVHAADAGVQAI